MKLHTINTGFFKLDGGAMFGVVPKVIWKKLNPPDENNLCTWAMRCLLIEKDDKKILIDTGLGNKQSEKFFGHYYLHGDDSLKKSIHNLGLTYDDITDVILTHLHFDHCGDAVSKNENGDLYPTFPNATYWSHKEHWEWAKNPNDREKASFLKENFVPLEEHGVVKFIEEHEPIIPEISYTLAHGHTESMIIPHINYNGRTIVFMADLLPSPYHIPMPYVMAYDVRPLQTLREKKPFLQTALENNYVLYFEHDPDIECCTLKTNERQRIVMDKKLNLKELL